MQASDLLVEIEAISVNPADAKRRIRTAAEQDHSEPFTLGYDAVGIVCDLGAEFSGFSKGDRVWYAGDVNRPGSHAALQAVDHRIAALAPSSVSLQAAVSLPLVSLTAWEMLFDLLQVPTNETPSSLLVVGGVGSITLQLACKLTGLHLIATASRLETAEWCRKWVPIRRLNTTI
ncbi:Zinc-type alcohol dehydrogenase-like protein [Ruegeria atlantica]|uniref:Zinc-type alcohol dehydrogenase-like protein n=2 Tax=Ruegeria atlantica TaxID=81569 RepID=A0A0P1E3F3_9RHOB|nr:Zinc-type alcohol dehydrogenase-like protein [Ruegeria atlantica]